MLNAKHDLPRRSIHSHKNSAGKALVFAGSAGMWGAAILCAEAASRSGSGYVYLCSPQGKFPALKHPDFLTVNLRNIQFSLFSSIAVGPGTRNSTSLQKLILKLSAAGFENVVLDAGALRALARMKNPPQLPMTWVLTPHEGELADLLGITAAEVHAHRAAYAHLAQQIWGCIVVLKGHHTLVASHNEIWKIPTGNPALAKAGTGDVLTGIITGLLAQGLSSREAACLGVFVHGAIADHWVNTKDILSLTPMDLLHELPQTLHRIRQGRAINKT